MEKQNKIRLARIIAGALLLGAAYVIYKNTSLELWQYLLIYLVPYFVAGYDVVFEAVENIFHGEVFDEDFLMCVATFGALGIGFLPGAEPQFTEAVFIMLFFQVGELFEEIAEGKSRRSVKALMDIRPDTANVLRGGELVEVDPASVAVGEYIVIRAGERVPLDGVVAEGESSLDTSALTGESLPRKASPGARVYSGCIVQNGVLTVRVTSEYANSTVAGILEMMENLPEGKSRRERFITRFARVYTPAVVGAAILLAVIPPLFSTSFSAAFPSYFTRALTFLVVSCPCALVISVPLAFFGGIGGAASKGVLIKGASFVESLADLGTVVFDKTGTLTEGVFKVTAVHPEKLDPDSLLHLAAHVESFSTHPIALSLRQAFGTVCSECSVEDIREYAGEGICARVNGSAVAVGNEKLMRTVGAEIPHCDMCGGYGTVIHVACDGVYAGHVVISDKIKDDAKDAIDGLRTNGVTRTVMLTGDRREVAEFVASKLGADDFHAELLPADKVSLVKEEAARMSGKRTLAFVGDGINDAPVLACADIGIAMGALGSDAAIEASDVVLMDDKPSKIVFAVKAAKRTLRIAKQNVAFALITKAVILALAVFGFAPLWLAVFGDVGVTVLAVLNSMRALRAVNSECYRAK